MSEELLSALLDGECTPVEVERLLRQLDESPALKQRWTRMCLAREAAENTRIRAVSPDFCSGIMAAIEREAAVEPVRSPKVVPLQPRRAAAAPVAAAASRSRWQPVVGLAAAASIAAVVTVGGYRWLSQPVGGAAVTVASAGPSATGSAGMQPVAYATAPQQQAKLVQVSNTSGGNADEPVETRWSQLDADTASQLSEYMMEHSNMRAEQGVGGALSYPRMMVRTAEYRTSGQH
ncbi:MAG: hypothetical protein JWR07_4483 [Nevskia sp.]|nr:hypothetical protein [Nevskia sp.]